MKPTPIKWCACPTQGILYFTSFTSRFFNYNEKEADILDWNSVKVYEKIDGCLATLYYYNNEWHVASDDTPDASDEVVTQLTGKH